MMRIRTMIGWIAAAGISAGVYAAPLSGSWDDNAWKAEISASACRLAQVIPGYGTAQFSNLPGKRLSFQVFSVFESPRDYDGAVEVRFRPAPWHADQPVQSGTRQDLNAGPLALVTSPATAQEYADQLLDGREISFTHLDLRGFSEPMTASLSPLGFGEAYEKFTTCQNALPSYNFVQARKTDIFFKTASSDLDESAEAALLRLQHYVAIDPKIQTIRISGYTDSVGRVKDNKHLAELRIETVKAFLLASGVPEEKFEVIPFGERQPAGDNRTKDGRAFNRRVAVELMK